MKKVFTVFGSTGEYSDRDEWPVCSFFNEDFAKERVVKATRRAKDIEVKCDGDLYSIGDPGLDNEYDDKMKLDYTGTSYFYVATDILDS